MTKLDEETLMAYVDGQLDRQRAAEVEALLVEDAEARATVRMFQDSAITSQSGKRMPVSIDSVLVHGDTPGAADLAALVRARLQQSGLQVRPISQHRN